MRMHDHQLRDFRTALSSMNTKPDSTRTGGRQASKTLSTSILCSPSILPLYLVAKFLLLVMQQFDEESISRQ